jgi:DNA repair photolyase
MPDPIGAIILPGPRTRDTEGIKHLRVIEGKKKRFHIPKCECERKAILPWKSNGCDHGLKKHKVEPDGSMEEMGDLALTSQLEKRKPKPKSISSSNGRAVLMSTNLDPNELDPAFERARLRIPAILRDIQGARFVPILNRQKEPAKGVSSRWDEIDGKNYGFNDPTIVGFLAEKHNYGVVCGFANLIVADIEDIGRLEALGIAEKIPSTFTVKTGRPTGQGRHFYLICPDLEAKIILFDPELKDIDGEPLHLGEIQSHGCQVVGPNSIHPSGNRYEALNDLPIATISKADLLNIFKKLIVEDTATKDEQGRRQNRKQRCSGGLSIGDHIPIDEVAYPAKVKEHHGSEIMGSHPIHGSTTGKNFAVNTAKNCWHCFRCDSGGGPLEWLAVEAGLIQCKDAKRGCLDKETFRKVLQIAKDRGFRIPEPRPKELWKASKEEIGTLYNAVCENLKGKGISIEVFEQTHRAFNPRLNVELEDTNFISRYMTYAKTTCDAYEEYHFASGLVLLSVAVDRQIVISMKQGDLYPNIWIFPLGDSTISRKTTAHKLCKLILRSKYPKKSLPSSFSPEALMDAIASTPRCYYMKDEAGSLLASLCKDYMQETRDFLAEIYECDDYYRKLKKSECIITDPYITQYLMTTPDNLKEYTKTLDLTSGWLLRYLWMYPNYPKDWKPFAEKDDSDFDRYTEILGQYNLVVEKLSQPRRLSMTQESWQFFQDWHRQVEEAMMKDADNITKALAGRLTTNAVKMAALFTIGREDFDENSMIELPHIKEAARLVIEYFLPIGKIIIDEVARSESQNVQDKIIGTIKRANGKIIQRDLLRALHLKLKDVDEAIEALIQSEEIERATIDSKSCYILTKREDKECLSVIVSHNEVYKPKSKEKNTNESDNTLYTPHLDTKTLLQLGQDGPKTGKIDRPIPISLEAIYKPNGEAFEYARLGLNLYTGCSHKCTYCYNKDRFNGSYDQPRKGASLENIEHDLKVLGSDRTPIHLSFVGDPYDTGRNNGYTRFALELFKKYNHPFQVLTKGGTKAVQDFDLYFEGCRFGVTLTCDNPDDSKKWEPGAALPEDRINALRLAHAKGIETWVSLEPVIDPAQTLHLIELTHEFVDHYGVGKLNHVAEIEKNIDWSKFRVDVEAKLKGYGKAYKIKAALDKASKSKLICAICGADLTGHGHIKKNGKVYCTQPGCGYPRREDAKAN